MAMTPSATPLATRAALRSLRNAGLQRLAVSLDGADPATHDAFRGVEGSFARTLEIMDNARRLSLPLQVNTTVTRRNLHQLDAMADDLARRSVVLWSVFFLVPVGRGALEERITPEQYEEVFERLLGHARLQPYAIKTTEAPHYRRFVLERRVDPRTGGSSSFNRTVQRAPLGVNDGKGVMFISHTGEVYPSGFLPICCGRFPFDSVVDVYQRAALFRALRDPDRLGGKCGLCEFRKVCGGSRARAFAVSGDPLAEEPDCTYIPKR
jgi:MoaA/NifB/PqqE/SkfB family radical SAM enzyme